VKLLRAQWTYVRSLDISGSTITRGTKARFRWLCKYRRRCHF